MISPTIDDSDGSAVATEWAVRVIIALVFVVTGIEKVLPESARSWIPIFDAIGFGQWFRYFTGGYEALGGLLFLVPAATNVGAAILISAMLGAMATQAFVLGHPGSSVFPAFYLAAVLAAFFRLRRRASR